MGEYDYVAHDDLEWAERYVTEGARQIHEQGVIISALTFCGEIVTAELETLRILEIVQALNVAVLQSMNEGIHNSPVAKSQ